MEMMKEYRVDMEVFPLLQSLVRSRVLWGHISGDRQKRVLIEELADLLGKERKAALPMLKDDLQFLARWGHKLEDKHNNVIHAPVDLIRNALAAGMPDSIPYGAIVAALLNARGKKLEGPSRRRGRELLAAVRLYRDYATVLASYARALRNAWQAIERGRRRAWPKRPILPRLRDED
jgi:hypothetical protein